jgi:hypothetical protein
MLSWQKNILANVSLRDVQSVPRAQGHVQYGVVLIDGLYRDPIVPIAAEALATIDFYVSAPSLSLPHFRSIFF